MRIKIKVKTNSKSLGIEKVVNSEYDYLVKVKALPHKGEANEEIIKTLSKFFKVSKSAVVIVSGSKNKIKLIEIVDK